MRVKIKNYLSLNNNLHSSHLFMNFINILTFNTYTHIEKLKLI